MVKRMLIDATHPEETRVVVLNGNRLEDFDFESSTKKQLKGNVYLAKVTRVEPSLQAAFVEYGGNRHGFLSFNEIHPDYYRIPVADREALMAEAAAESEAARESNGDGEGEVETLGGDEMEEMPVRRPRPTRQYKIQEVITRRQIMLVQVVKEERGTKGAALTTYLSLAGRYCVLMPNTPRGGGVSRKITSALDRKRLKTMLDEFDLPEGMAVIVRTAGMERAKPEIKRDYEYLLRLWDEIRELTLKSTAPSLIHEEGNLIKRAIRDVYTRDIDEVLVEGEDGYKTAKAFMKMIVPSHARRVQPYRDPAIPLMHRYQVETQIDAIHSPTVQLRSGGYIVINPTEALVAIDVNSGRATRERHIEETALKTNLEAADEVARQIRLRDLAGLIVVDFIDMEESRNNHAVERRIKEAMKNDRARIQIGKISPFGLLELSRQRLRPSLLEASTQICPHCQGSGTIRSTESTALHVLRAIEEEGITGRCAAITIIVPTVVALYILNQKRQALADIETRYHFEVIIGHDDSLIPPAYRLERTRQRAPGEFIPLPVAPVHQVFDADDDADDVEIEEDVETEVEAVDEARDAAPAENGESEAQRRSKRRRGRRRRGRRDEPQNAVEGGEALADSSEAPEAEGDGEEDGAELEVGATDGADGIAAGDTDDDGNRKRRRRGRRGGRRRGRRNANGALMTDEENLAADAAESAAAEAVDINQVHTVEAPAYMLEPEAAAEVVVSAPEPGSVSAPVALETLAPAVAVDESMDREETVAESVVIPVMRQMDGLTSPVTAQQITLPQSAVTEPAPEPETPKAPPAGVDIIVVDKAPENPKRGWWGRLTR